MTDTPSTVHSTQRLPLIDVARGGALVAMAIYHFTWDLEFFGYVERGTTAYGGWKLFARLIAGSFLFLVGISLVLGHGKGIRWRSFGKRLAMIAAAAGLITLATYFATPDRFIFFGILHNIAVSSVFGLLFVRLPAIISLMAGLVILFAGPYLTGPLFDHSLLLWLGLFTVPVTSNDLVPFFPWTACVLFGISAAKLATDRGMIPRLATIYRGENRLGKILSFGGRHSLAVYHLHQPLLIGLVNLASLLVPANVTHSPASVIRDCKQTCVRTDTPEFCARYCQCVVDELVATDLLQSLPSSRSPGDLRPEIRAITNSCAEAHR